LGIVDVLGGKCLSDVSTNDPSANIVDNFLSCLASQNEH